MKIKIIALIIFCISNNLVMHGQVKVSEIIQESNLAVSETNKLYFVDFWATWCVPCRYAKKIITETQRNFPKDLHVISISDENSDKVERFITKNPSQLTVVVDYKKSTFNTYEINTLPDGILFNAEGKVLWRGHPADLTPKVIKGFLASTKKRKSLNKFLEVINDPENEITSVKEYTSTKSVEVKQISETLERLQYTESSNSILLKGKLSELISHLSQTYIGQIKVPSQLDKNYQVYLKKPLLKDQNYGFKVLETLGYDFLEKTASKEVVKLKIKKPAFWDVNQIDWGKNVSTHLITDTDITANDTSLKTLSYLLATALDKPVVLICKDSSIISSLHDWQIHYKYFEFLKSNFQDYGIQVTNVNSEFTEYHVIKKAP